AGWQIEPGASVGWIPDYEIKFTAGILVQAVADRDHDRQLLPGLESNRQEYRVEGDLRQPRTKRIDLEAAQTRRDILDKNAGAAPLQFPDDATCDGGQERTAARSGIEDPSSAPVDACGRRLMDQPVGQTRRCVIDAVLRAILSRQHIRVGNPDL